jgi:alcohol dehydrogenase
MRSLVLHGAGSLVWDDAPTPRLQGDGDALVAPLAVARCDLDLALSIGLTPSRGRLHMGHEMVGVVIDHGDDAGAVRAGDRVIVPFQISCGQCEMCARGLTNACTAVPHGSAYGLGPFGGVEWGGALSDLVRVPFASHMLIPLPDGMDPVDACGVPDNASDGYRCVAEPMRRWPGEDVLVVGGAAQSVGLYAVASAVALGAPRVVYVDDDPARLELASSLGAEVRDGGASALTADDSFAITVDATVTPDGQMATVRATAPCGIHTCVSAGGPANLPMRRMYMQGISFELGRVHARSTAPAVLDLMATGRLDVAAVIGSVVPFDDAPDAMLDPQPKVVFVNDEHHR